MRRIRSAEAQEAQKRFGRHEPYAALAAITNFLDALALDVLKKCLLYLSVDLPEAEVVLVDGGHFCAPLLALAPEAFSGQTANPEDYFQRAFRGEHNSRAGTAGPRRHTSEERFSPEVSARQRDRIAAKYRGRSPSGDARPGKSYRAGLAKGRRFLGEAQKGQSLSGRRPAAATISTIAASSFLAAASARSYSSSPGRLSTSIA